MDRFSNVEFSLVFQRMIEMFSKDPSIPFEALRSYANLFAYQYIRSLDVDLASRRIFELKCDFDLEALNQQIRSNETGKISGVHLTLVDCLSKLISLKELVGKIELNEDDIPDDIKSKVLKNLWRLSESMELIEMFYPALSNSVRHVLRHVLLMLETCIESEDLNRFMSVGFGNFELSCNCTNEDSLISQFKMAIESLLNINEQLPEPTFSNFSRLYNQNSFENLSKLVFKIYSLINSGDSARIRELDIKFRNDEEIQRLFGVNLAIIPPYSERDSSPRSAETDSSEDGISLFSDGSESISHETLDNLAASDIYSPPSLPKINISSLPIVSTLNPFENGSVCFKPSSQNSDVDVCGNSNEKLINSKMNEATSRNNQQTLRVLSEESKSFQEKILEPTYEENLTSNDHEVPQDQSLSSVIPELIILSEADGNKRILSLHQSPETVSNSEVEDENAILNPTKNVPNELDNEPAQLLSNLSSSRGDKMLPLSLKDCSNSLAANETGSMEMSQLRLSDILSQTQFDKTEENDGASNKETLSLSLGYILSTSDSQPTCHDERTQLHLSDFSSLMCSTDFNLAENNNKNQNFDVDVCGNSDEKLINSKINTRVDFQATSRNNQQTLRVLSEESESFQEEILEPTYEENLTSNEHEVPQDQSLSSVIPELIILSEADGNKRILSPHQSPENVSNSEVKDERTPLFPNEILNPTKNVLPNELDNEPAQLLSNLSSSRGDKLLPFSLKDCSNSWAANEAGLMEMSQLRLSDIMSQTQFDKTEENDGASNKETLSLSLGYILSTNDSQPTCHDERTQLHLSDFSSLMCSTDFNHVENNNKNQFFLNGAPNPSEAGENHSQDVTRAIGSKEGVSKSTRENELPGRSMKTLTDTLPDYENNVREQTTRNKINELAHSNESDDSLIYTSSQPCATYPLGDSYDSNNDQSIAYGLIAQYKEELSLDSFDSEIMGDNPNLSDIENYHEGSEGPSLSSNEEIEVPVSKGNLPSLSSNEEIEVPVSKGNLPSLSSNEEIEVPVSKGNLRKQTSETSTQGEPPLNSSHASEDIFHTTPKKDDSRLSGSQGTKDAPGSLESVCVSPPRMNQEINRAAPLADNMPLDQQSSLRTSNSNQRIELSLPSSSSSSIGSPCSSQIRFSRRRLFNPNANPMLMDPPDKDEGITDQNIDQNLDGNLYRNRVILEIMKNVPKTTKSLPSKIARKDPPRKSGLPKTRLENSTQIGNSQNDKNKSVTKKLKCRLPILSSDDDEVDWIKPTSQPLSKTVTSKDNNTEFVATRNPIDDENVAILKTLDQGSDIEWSDSDIISTIAVMTSNTLKSPTVCPRAVINPTPELKTKTNLLSQSSDSDELSSVNKKLQTKLNKRKRTLSFSNSSSSDEFLSKDAVRRKRSEIPSRLSRKRLNAVRTNKPQINNQPDALQINQPQTNSQPDTIESNKPQRNKQLDALQINQPQTSSQPDAIESNKPQLNNQADTRDSNKPQRNKQLDALQINQPQTNSQPDAIESNKPQLNNQADTRESNKPQRNKQLDALQINQPQTNSQPDAIESNKPQLNNQADTRESNKPQRNKQLDALQINQPQTNSQPDAIESNKPQLNNQAVTLNSNKSQINNQPDAIKSSKPQINNLPDSIKGNKAQLNNQLDAIKCKKSQINNQPDVIKINKPPINNQLNVIESNKPQLNNQPSIEPRINNQPNAIKSKKAPTLVKKIPLVQLSRLDYTKDYSHGQSSESSNEFKFFNKRKTKFTKTRRASWALKDKNATTYTVNNLVFPLPAHLNPILKIQRLNPADMFRQPLKEDLCLRGAPVSNKIFETASTLPTSSKDDFHENVRNRKKKRIIIESSDSDSETNFNVDGRSSKSSWNSDNTLPIDNNIKLIDKRGIKVSSECSDDRDYLSDETLPIKRMVSTFISEDSTATDLDVNDSSSCISDSNEDECIVQNKESSKRKKRIKPSKWLSKKETNHGAKKNKNQNRKPWSHREEELLCIGIEKYGTGHWHRIATKFGILRSSQQLYDKWRNLCKGNNMLKVEIRVEKGRKKTDVVKKTLVEPVKPSNK